MSLKKDDIVEVVEKDDNGWWLVKKDGAEGWAPNNYLEPVPPQAAASLPPPAPPRKTPPAPKIIPTSIVANASAKPISVFPGMKPANGTAAPWKQTPSRSDDLQENSRPSSVSTGKVPPPLSDKPKLPVPPVVGVKPSVTPKVGGKPPIPTAPRPTPAAPPRPGASVGKHPTAPGQVDLAAAVSSSFLVFIVHVLMTFVACETCPKIGRDLNRIFYFSNSIPISSRLIFFDFF
jgi:myosin-1